MPIRFGPFELDLRAATLRRDGAALEITPKGLTVLGYLAGRAGELVTKDELWKAAWPRVIVTDAALTVCISEIRRVLGERANAPHYITTVHRRGYRFVAQVFHLPDEKPDSASRQIIAPPKPETVLVGRTRELEWLDAHWQTAARGVRQLVLIGGEPGIGKTALVGSFLAGIDHRDTWIAYGQCVDHAGTAEAYLPILDALGRLGRGVGYARLVPVLERHAPTWLTRLPSLSPNSADTSAATAAPTAERMLRELAEAIEALAADTAIVLWLEDLHWSDHSTVAWLCFMARRPDPARLLIVASYRPLEIADGGHPLLAVKRELFAHGLCHELNLEGLSAGAVSEYLNTRAPSALRGACQSRDLAALVHRRTNGNPLFVINIADYLVASAPARDWQVGSEDRVLTALPEGLRQMITCQFERMSPIDQRALLSASLAGTTFSAAELAELLGEPVESADSQCARLARSSLFLAADGVSTWPDGTVAGQYSFRHALYRDIIQERLAPATAIAMHRALAARLERAFATRSDAIAIRLAEHHEQGSDWLPAARCRLAAGEQAARLGAYHDATLQFDRGLQVLDKAGGADSAPLELALRLASGSALIATAGGAAAMVETRYSRAAELARGLGDREGLFRALFGLRSSALARGALEPADGLGHELLELATALDDTDLSVEAHLALGNTAFQLGEFSRARRHLEYAVAAFDPKRSERHALHFGIDPGVFCRALLAMTLHLLGYSAQALHQSEEACRMAHQGGHAYSRCTAENFAAWLAVMRDEPVRCLEHATLAGFPSAVVLAAIRGGWARNRSGRIEVGIAEIRAGLEKWRNLGAVLGLPHFLALLARACRTADATVEAAVVIDEAVHAAEQTGERWALSELYRLRGDVLRDQGAPCAVVAAAYEQAIACARAQGALHWELEAVLALASLNSAQGLREEAKTAVQSVYEKFDDGLDMPILEDTRRFLMEP